MNRPTTTAIALSAGILFLSVLPNASQAASEPACGTASWYQLTSRTASGEFANPSKMTAAHKSMKFGSKIEVQNMSNGKKVIVRINDRGPFIKGRVLDLTRAAAGKLGFVNAGTTKVCYKIVS